MDRAKRFEMTPDDGVRLLPSSSDSSAHLQIPENVLTFQTETRETRNNSSNEIAYYVIIFVVIAVIVGAISVVYIYNTTPGTTDLNIIHNNNNKNNNNNKDNNNNKQKSLPLQPSCSDETLNASVCTHEICVQVANDIQSYMNESFDPCNDFYKYSCDGWINNHPASIDESPEVLGLMYDENINILTRILEKRNVHVSSQAERKARDFYTSCIHQDTDKTPLDYISDDEKINDKILLDFLLSNNTYSNQSATYFTIRSEKLRKLKYQFNYDSFFDFNPVGQNYLINHNHKSGEIFIQMQCKSTTTLMENYFEKIEWKKNSSNQEFLSQVRKILVAKELTENVLQDKVNSIVNFEKKLSLIQPMSSEPKSLRLNLKQMANLIPLPLWKKSFSQHMNRIEKNLSLKLVFALSPSEAEYLQNLKMLLNFQLQDEIGRETLSNHMNLRLVKSRMNSLKQNSPESDILKNAFGLEEIGMNTDYAQNCTFYTMTFFPDVISRLFVSEMFSSEKREHANTMFNTIKQSYKNLVNNIGWLSRTTKYQVQYGLTALPILNGYPETIMDLVEVDNRYRLISISNDTYRGNTKSLQKDFLLRYLLAKVRNEVDVTTVNAFYYPKVDKIFLPAGILREPMFHPMYPKVINYAKLGFALGHEMSHAFQNYLPLTPRCYSLYDCDYVYGDPARCIESFYGKFNVDEHSKLNGTATFVENFADIAGIQVSYNAYKKNFCQEYQSLPGLEKFTEDQIFFIASAQWECASIGSKQLTEKLKQGQINGDAHSPNSVRVEGSLTQFKKFAEAFNCPVGSLYNVDKKCKVF